MLSSIPLKPHTSQMSKCLPNSKLLVALSLLILFSILSPMELKLTTTMLHLQVQATFGNHVCICVCVFLFFSFFSFFSCVCENCDYCSCTVHEQQPQSLTFLTFFNQSVHTMHCSWTHKFHFSATFSLKMGPRYYSYI